MMTLESDIAKKLFTITQTNLPFKNQNKMKAWDDLSLDAKLMWFNRATEIIEIVKTYCPFSPSYRGDKR
jgi:hypothetical protein